MDVEYFDGRLFVGWRKGSSTSPQRIARCWLSLLRMVDRPGTTRPRLFWGRMFVNLDFSKWEMNSRCFFEAGTYFAAFELSKWHDDFRRGLGDWARSRWL